MVFYLQTDITNHLQVPRPKPKHGADFFFIAKYVILIAFWVAIDFIEIIFGRTLI